MPYIIDGNNLIGSSRDISLDDKDAREKIVNLIRKFQESKNTKITVVFDGEPSAGLVKNLVRDGKMTTAGMSKVGSWIGDKENAAPPETRIDEIPDFIRKALAENQAAGSNFSLLAPGYRKLYVRWVDSAKREETRHRRLAEMIGLLEANRKLGMK